MAGVKDVTISPVSFSIICKHCRFQEPFRNTLSARIEDRPGTGTSRGTSALPLSPEQTNEPSSSSDPHPAESSQPSKADVMDLNDDSDDAEAFL